MASVHVYTYCYTALCKSVTFILQCELMSVMPTCVHTTQEEAIIFNSRKMFKINFIKKDVSDIFHCHFKAINVWVHASVSGPVWLINIFHDLLHTTHYISNILQLCFRSQPFRFVWRAQINKDSFISLFVYSIYKVTLLDNNRGFLSNSLECNFYIVQEPLFQIIIR